ncbi:MAG: hybrid sensor histidine kinase/response regulator [Polyangiales bacterium]
MRKAIRHTVLVIDDEPDVLQSVKDLLRFDYKVVTATRASEGIKALAEQEVHVVMTDQRMPEMTGVEFLHHVRGEHPDAIRLLFTGYADLKAVIDAINQGNVYRYITKPWDPSELQSVIREACERYDLIVERKRLIDELQEKNAELERADVLKTSFLRVVAHELRTPITLQLGLTQLALRTDGLTPVVRDRLERIERAGQKLYRRAEQLMVLLHREEFAQNLERAPTDLAALVAAVVDDVRPFVERRGQTLTVDVPSDLGEVRVDAQKIQDALELLLLNAVKFTPDGGHVSLTARRRADEGATLEVVDDGVGIPAEQMSHLFEPFFTGFDSEHHSSGDFAFGARGLGLGLSVVKAFVGMHGGRVSARSEPGHTVFTIDLPGA